MACLSIIIPTLHEWSHTVVSKMVYINTLTVRKLVVVTVVEKKNAFENECVLEKKARKSAPSHWEGNLYCTEEKHYTAL